MHISPTFPDQNIIQDETEEQRIERKKSLKSALARKISMRSSVKDLKKKRILR